jgi:DNA-binding MarR family transcriptional regulator
MTAADCDPSACPCIAGNCTLSRVARSVPPGPRGTGTQRTLNETEEAVATRLSGMTLDMPAMAAISNLHRAAGAVRNHFERTVLAPQDLTWTGWVVLWVVWIWEEIEARHVAEEAGISKGTLTGVVRTLEGKALLTRRTHPDDARRVLISLTPTGTELMADLFPEFNQAESKVVQPLNAEEIQVLTTALRRIVMRVESEQGNGA